MHFNEHFRRVWERTTAAITTSDHTENTVTSYVTTRSVPDYCTTSWTAQPSYKKWVHKDDLDTLRYALGWATSNPAVKEPVSPKYDMEFEDLFKGET